MQLSGTIMCEPWPGQKPLQSPTPWEILRIVNRGYIHPSELCDLLAVHSNREDVHKAKMLCVFGQQRREHA